MTPPASTPPQTTSFGGDTPVTIQSQDQHRFFDHEDEAVEDDERC
jgi:hypothetical protein